MRLNHPFGSLALLVVTNTLAGAQQRPPIRPIGAVVAKSAETFTNVAGIRALSDGAVLVNDIAGRRVLLFDAQLGKFTIVADSTSATANAYGGRTGSLVPYKADSSIFVDPASVSMLVIDPSGKVARVMAVPRAEDAMMIGSPMGNTAFDASGRLIYRAGARLQIRGAGAGGPPPGGAGTFHMLQPPDSALILGVDLSTRKLDTLGYIRTPVMKMEMNRDDKGNVTARPTINPLPVVDDWAVLSDGSVAFVRGRDYHIDWLNPDGTKTSTAKIPFDWQRMTDEDKVAFIDSVKAARDRLGANAPVPLGGGAPGGGGGGAAVTQGGGAQVMIFGGPGSGGGPGGNTVRTLGGATTQVQFVSPSELPDYKPPFFAGSARADADGNLWIRTIPTAAIAGGPVYDVINRKGQIIDRVQVPEGRTIVGFGKAGVVYMTNRQGTAVTLEKATVR